MTKWGGRHSDYLRCVPLTSPAMGRAMQEGPRSDAEEAEITRFVYDKARRIREARGDLTAEQIKQIDVEDDG